MPKHKRSAVDEFIAECEAIIILFRSGNLPVEFLKERFDLAIVHWGVA